jgi:hypothetical protein
MDRQPLEYRSAPDLKDLKRPYQIVRRCGLLACLVGFAMALLTGFLVSPVNVPVFGATIAMIGIGLVILGVAAMLVSGAAGAVLLFCCCGKKGK